MVRESVFPTLRAVVFAAACLALGAAAHRAMSGSAIPGWALVVGGVGAYAPARYAAGRGERGFAGIAVLMGLVQLALHVLFSYAQHLAVAGSAAGTNSSAAMAGMPAMPAMPMPMPTAANMPMGTAMPGPGAADSMHMSTGMLVGHAVAALVCAWWLWRGETALHAVIRRAGFALHCVWVVVLRAAPPADFSVPLARIESPRALRPQWRRGVLAQRGPPPLAW